MLGRLERDGRGRYGMKKGTSTWEMMEEKVATSGGEEFSANQLQGVMQRFSAL